MSTPSRANWPSVELDSVAHLRVLATASRATVMVDAVVPVLFDELWPVVSDLEHELPALLPDVRSFRLLSARGDRLRFAARSRAGLPARFDVVLRPGWCLMQSRYVFGAMAAAPRAGGTGFVFAGAFRIPGHRLVAPLLRPLLRRLGRRMLSRLQRRLAAGG